MLKADINSLLSLFKLEIDDSYINKDFISIDTIEPTDSIGSGVMISFKKIDLYFGFGNYINRPDKFYVKHNQIINTPKEVDTRDNESKFGFTMGELENHISNWIENEVNPLIRELMSLIQLLISLNQIVVLILILIITTKHLVTNNMKI